MTRALILLLLWLLPGPAAAQAPPPAADREVTLDRLPPQLLEKGACGLFLWTRSTTPVLVLFADHPRGRARLALGGRTLDLPRVGFEGQALYGHSRTQRFSGEGLDLVVTLDLDDRRDLLGGAVVPSATLRLTRADGWTTVVPVGGMIACETFTR